MLVSFAHGQQIPLTNGQDEKDCSHFGYLFGGAPTAPFDPDTLKNLDAVHRDMVEASADPGRNHSSLPPIFTYIGQFIDHDITGMTANTNTTPLPDIRDDTMTPQPRKSVVEALLNVRTGQFDLDSLYGREGPSGNAALDKLNSLLRFPKDRAFMWIGTFGDMSRRVKFPKDPAADLLRLDRLLQSGRFTEDDIDALPEEHRKLFKDDAGNLNLSRAIIGDARNDENLFIAQVHLAFLRFHNRVVAAWPKKRKNGDEDEVFEWARTQVRRFYQWLVINVWLPGVCDVNVVREILNNGPALFDDFLTNCDWKPGDRLPMPLEFSTGAFRFGHSMVRGDYDWNENFGRGEDFQLERASFELMFLFTGMAPQPMGGNGPRLPANWGADWDRLVHPLSQFSDRTTRQIDTVLADPLTNMVNEGNGPVIRNLIARNLRRGVLHNLATAQEAIAKMAQLGIRVPKLTKSQIASGATSGEIKAGNFDEHTPLWFYVLKEAEIQANGQKLGSLGSHLVAGTILGLILRGPNSVWDVPGSNEGRWHPVDGPRVSGQLVDSFPAFIRAALLMENPDA